MIDRRLCIAPMLDWTDRHCRYFLRLITPHALLYTEMIHVNAVLKGDRKKLLDFDPSEHPVALQLGGSTPEALAEASKIAEDYGYDEVNLNSGCPSERVQAGSFGACLMAEPNLVADCIAAMRAVVKIPVTVKCRIGIDKEDSYSFFKDFILTVNEAGAEIFIIHARSAWLKGLSPKENRDIPPLKYDYVYRLKEEEPELTLVINGGIKTETEIAAHLCRVDGIMLGREAYHNPYYLAELDKQIYADSRVLPSRLDLLEAYLPYIEEQVQAGVNFSSIKPHLSGLYHGQQGGRIWRQQLSENIKNIADFKDFIRHHSQI